ncbi:MAG: hypothetical protein KatS3mg111_3587 [Pirellulaceae bacterium]|nr:MAG: hypothetical protein KatS3mg111_3587 [Pirellulaceae bacterium]
MNRRTLVLLVMLVMAGTTCSSGSGQQSPSGSHPILFRPIYLGDYDPYYYLSPRIHAQADLIRAQSVAAVSYAQARVLHAAAYNQELDNWVKEVKAYWERRKINERGKLEKNHIEQIKRLSYLNDHRWKNHRTWERIKHHPELNNYAIKKGTALNFLLARLAVSALPYEFDPQTTIYSAHVLDDLVLDRAWLSDIQLRYGGQTFSATQPADGLYVAWPYLLRWDEFAARRHAYEASRKVMFVAAREAEEIPVAAMRAAEEKLMELSAAYHGSAALKSWVET